MTPNAELTKKARETLAKNRWGVSILTHFIYLIISSAAGRFFPVGLVIGGPMQVGVCTFNLKLARRKHAELNQLFLGFKKFEKSLIAYLLVIIYVILWSLLLIIPGIIAAISYSQTFYLLADNDRLSWNDAMKKSQQMMVGKKWKYFWLNLRFLGWLLLSLLTLGIGFLWLIPYMNLTFAYFYEDIKK